MQPTLAATYAQPDTAERNRPANIGRHRMRTLPRTYKGASTRRSGGAAWQQQGRIANPTIFSSFSFHYFFFFFFFFLFLSFLCSHTSHMRRRKMSDDTDESRLSTQTAGHQHERSIRLPTSLTEGAAGRLESPPQAIGDRASANASAAAQWQKPRTRARSGPGQGPGRCRRNCCQA